MKAPVLEFVIVACRYETIENVTAARPKYPCLYLFGQKEHGRCRRCMHSSEESATPSLSSSVSALLPVPSESVSRVSLASSGKASDESATPSLSSSVSALLPVSESVNRVGKRRMNLPRRRYRRR